MIRKIIAASIISMIFPSVFADDRGLSLTFIGDIMAHDVNYRMKNFNAIYANVAEYFRTDDLTFGNLEFAIVEDLPFSTYPLFNVRSAYVQSALDAHFEVFSIANNHTLDKGELGVLKTLASLLLLKEGVDGEMYYSGIRGNPNKPFAPVTIYKNGYKIGFLAVTQFLNIRQLTPYIHVVDYLNREEAERFVEWMRSITPQYDLFILSYHGDIEYQLSPHPEKQAFFRSLVQAGVDIIWGHHPHVLQPYEIVEVAGTKRLIMYSLGNFVSGQGYYVNPATPAADRAYTGDSALIRVKVNRNGNNEASVINVETVLISNYTTPANEIIVDKLETLAIAPLAAPWREYYKTRLKIMTDFFNNMDTYLNKGNLNK